MEISKVFLCCQYCKQQFCIKDELYFHWYKTCVKYCNCDNCHIPVYVQVDSHNRICVFYNRTNLDVPVIQVLKQYLPNVKFENLFFSESEDVEMTAV